jgi:hypothetical protein
VDLGLDAQTGAAYLLITRSHPRRPPSPPRVAPPRQLDLGRRISEGDLGRGTAVLVAAADLFERLGVMHVASRTRRFARGVVA